MTLPFVASSLNRLGGNRPWAAVVGDAIAVANDAGAQPVARDQFQAATHRLVTALPGTAVWLTTLSLPATDPRELQPMLALQLDNLTPLPLEDVVVASEPLGRDANSTRLLVAIARKTAVNERVAALEAVGLPPEVVGVDVLTAFQAARRAGRLAKDGRLSAYVELSRLAATIILYRQEEPLVVRTTPLDEGADRAAVVFAELRRTLLAAQAELPSAEPGRMTFVAGADSERALADELRDRWGRDAESLPGGLTATTLCNEAVAAAPALNLLPDEWRQKRRAARRRKRLIQAGVTLLALYAAAIIALLAGIAWRQARLSGLVREANQLRPAYNEARELHGTLKAMRAQLDPTYSALEVLRETSALLPGNVKLNGFSFKKDQTISLRGQGPSAVTVNDFISRLENSTLFSAVKTVSVRAEGGATKFELVCTLKSAGPQAAATGRAR